MEHESMKTRPGGVTILRAGAALALVAALAACGGGSGTTATTGGGGCTGDTPYAVGDECFADKETADGIIAAREKVTETTGAADTRAATLASSLGEITQEQVDGLGVLVDAANEAIGELPEGERADATAAFKRTVDFHAGLVTIVADLNTPNPDLTAANDRASGVTTALAAARDANGNFRSASRTGSTGGSSHTAFTNITNLIRAKTALEAAIKELDSDGDGTPNEGSSAAQIQELAGYVADRNRINVLIRRAGRDLVSTGQNREAVIARGLANRVGQDIYETLTATAATRIAEGSTPPASTIASHLKAVDDDGKGLNWSDILENHVGDDYETRDERVGNNDRRVMGSVEGLLASNFRYDGDNIDGSIGEPDPDTGLTSATATGADSTRFQISSTDAHLTYRGIPGNLWCFGGPTGCSVNSDGELGKGWFFDPTQTRPDDSSATTVITDDILFVVKSGAYVVETYVSYGHWLTEPSGNWTVNTFSQSIGAPSGASGINAASLAHAGDRGPNSATYSGDAIGMSARTMGEDDDQEHHSGRFAAKVNLTANFVGAGDSSDADNTSTLGGKITGFEGVDAAGETVSGAEWVNTSWSVTLERAGFEIPSGGVATVGNSATASGGAVRDGAWTASAYGEDGDRPAGIHGTFNAFFSDSAKNGAVDGAAAGAYATKKE